MPMKNRYQYNRQVINLGQMYRIVPLGYMETLPGETLNGKVTADVFSAPTVRNIQTRTYSDIFAFFVPFRLLWEDWPNYIADNASGLSVPTLNTLATWNLENRLTTGTLGIPPDANTVWMRRAYRIVYEKFFAKQDTWDELTDVNKDAADWWTAEQRPSTFETATPPGDRDSIPIDTSGSSITVDEVRSAFALDQWDKMRNFYGSRYTDYMRAVGVETPWTLLEEPEVLGKKSGDWGYRTVSNMTADQSDPANDPLALNAGYFHNKQVLDIKRKFIPEHGLVCVYNVTRCEPYYQSSPVEPVLSKVFRSGYWSPEHESQKKFNYSNQILQGQANLAYDVERIPFDEYRRGTNVNVQEALANPEDAMALTAANVSSVNDPLQYDDNFVSGYFPNIGQFQTHYQATAEWRISRRSPLIRQGQSKPIY